MAVIEAAMSTHATADSIVGVIAEPLLGVCFHWLGGLASGSFYVPFRLVRHWSWETAWIVGGLFSWIIAPWVAGLALTSDLVLVLSTAWTTHPKVVMWTFIFGTLWGLGGLSFGLTMRYLGMSLGMAIALGYCAVFGTLVPPLFQGVFTERLLMTTGGRGVLFGIVICIAGICVAGYAGVRKESEQAGPSPAIPEFNLRKGFLIASFSGIMSSCFSFGLAAGEEISAISIAHGTSTQWSGLPVLVVLLAGGFATNLAWCLFLNARNRTWRDYLPRTTAVPHYKLSGSRLQAPNVMCAVPLTRNYFWAATAGVIWYFQFFFYTIGESMMGTYRFTSWTLHMASIIVFSTLWGLVLKEWRGAQPKTFQLLALAIALLIASTIIIGYSNSLS